MEYACVSNHVPPPPPLLLAGIIAQELTVKRAPTAKQSTGTPEPTASVRTYCGDMYSDDGCAGCLVGRHGINGCNGECQWVNGQCKSAPAAGLARKAAEFQFGCPDPEDIMIMVRVTQ